MPGPKIICVGEVLWDVLPSGMFLGGAPFNVACDLHQLGFPVTMTSRVGGDTLGTRVIEEMKRRRMTTESVQIDRVLPTGIVQVGIGRDGVPQYTIDHPSAWDAIEPAGEIAGGKKDEPSIVVFGSLAQRSQPTRSTIQDLCAHADVTIFDVNLRAPYDDKNIVHESLLKTTILKLNRDEAARIAGWFGLPPSGREFSEAISRRFGCHTVCITRDADGAEVWHQGAWSEHPGFHVDVKDAVGAGDAFLAGFIARYLDKKSWSEILEFANLLGAYVASSNGATPIFSEPDVLAFRESAILR